MMAVNAATHKQKKRQKEGTQEIKLQQFCSRGLPKRTHRRKGFVCQTCDEYIPPPPPPKRSFGSGEESNLVLTPWPGSTHQC